MATTATEPLGLSRRSNLDDLMSGLHEEVKRLKVALDYSRSENIRLSALVDQVEPGAKEWRQLQSWRRDLGNDMVDALPDKFTFDISSRDEDFVPGRWHTERDGKRYEHEILETVYSTREVDAI